MSKAYQYLETLGQAFQRAGVTDYAAYILTNSTTLRLLGYLGDGVPFAEDDQQAGDALNDVARCAFYGDQQSEKRPGLPDRLDNVSVEDVVRVVSTALGAGGVRQQEAGHVMSFVVPLLIGNDPEQPIGELSEAAQARLKYLVSVSVDAFKEAHYASLNIPRGVGLSRGGSA